MKVKDEIGAHDFVCYARQFGRAAPTKVLLFFLAIALVSAVGFYAHAGTAYEGYFDINGPTPGSDHDQINVTGMVTLNDPRLSLGMSTSFVPTRGQVYTLINTDGGDAGMGRVSNVTQGTVITLSGYQLLLSYAGGNGNDSTLTSLSGKEPSTTAIASSANPTGPGQPVTFTATVTGSTGTPGGTVTFKNGGVPIGSPVPLVAGVASTTTSALAVGSHSIAAEYGGDTVYEGSTSSAIVQVVQRFATTVRMTASTIYPLTGDQITFTVTVESSAGVPTGNVSFDNGAGVETSEALTNGSATFTTSYARAGTYTPIAMYTGAPNFEPNSFVFVLPVQARSVPDAPTIGTATAGNGRAAVSFTPPANDGGAPIESYTVTASPGGQFATGTTSPITVTGLTNGTTYTFTVTASNYLGASTPSSPSNAVTPAAAYCIAPPAGVVSWWTGDGNGVDSVGGQTLVPRGTASFDPAKYGRGLAMHAAGDGFQAPDSPSWHLQQLTVEAWVNATSASVGDVYGGMVAVKVLVDDPHVFPWNSWAITYQPATGQFLATVHPGYYQLPGQYIQSPTGFASGVWHHVAMTYDGATLKLYVDGTLQSQAAVSGEIGYSSYKLGVGGHAFGSGPPDRTLIGKIDDLKIYNRALDAGEIQDLYGCTPLATLPTPPTTVIAVSGNAQATVSFSGAGDGGSPITSYTVTSNPGGIMASGASSPITVSGLTNGTAYTFTVNATNEIGTSAPSAPSSAVTPATLPGAPTIGMATGGNMQATVAFLPPTDNGGSPITGYTVTTTPGTITASGSASPITVTGLSNCVAYTFSVTATNSLGTSQPSAASNSVTPRPINSAPLANPGGPYTVNLGDSLTLDGSASSDPDIACGDAITSYQWDLTTDGTFDIPGVNVTLSAAQLASFGISSPGIFNLTLLIADSFGGISSMRTTIAARTTPGAPTAARAAAWNGQATVRFTPPASNGGSAITSYTVTSNPTGLTASDSSSPITITGLNNGTAYTFTVTATNGAGTSAPSAPSNTVVPQAPHGSIPPAATAVFVADYGTGSIWRVFPDGTGAVEIASGLSDSLRGLAVDAAGRKVYFSVGAQVSRMNLDGSEREPVVSFPYACYDIELTAAAIYCSTVGPNILRAHRGTSAIDILPIGGISRALGIAIDEAGGQIYWADLPENDIGNIGRANFDGSARETLIVDRFVTNFVGIDPVNGHLYWTEGRYVGDVKRSGLDGSGMVTLVSGEASPAGLALDLGAGEMFWAREDGRSVGAAGLDGSQVQTLLGGLSRPLSLAILTGASALEATSAAIVSIAPEPSLVGQSYTVSVTVMAAAGAPSGTVAVDDGMGGTCSITLSSGAGSCSLGSSGAGTRTVTATYSGSVTYAASSASMTHSVIAATAPGAPTVGAAAAGDGQVTIGFTAPASDGGSAITGYTVTCSPGAKTGAGSASPITVTGLANGTTYGCSVSATNIAGTGASSASVSVTPGVVPAITSGAPPGGSFGVAYSFAYAASGSPAPTFSVSSGALPTGLTLSSAGVLSGTPSAVGTFNGFVSADNAIGSATQAFSITIVTTVPAAPVIGAATAGDSRATVEFTAPANDGGSAITSYTVTASPGNITAPGIASPITLTGLSNGITYTFTVTATNAVGTSAPSAASNAVTPKSPTVTAVGTITPEPSTVGQSYTVAVTVTAATGVATGSVTVSDELGATCTIAALASGAGSCALASMSAGTRTVTATYAGAAAFLGSAGTKSHVVNVSQTRTTISSSPNPSTLNQPVVFTATVVASGAGKGTPTGTVTFATNKLTLGTATLDSSGVATLPPYSALPVGNSNVFATYSGDSNYNGSRSAPAGQTVKK